MGEVGGVPSPEVMRQQPKWTYFMVWSEFVEWGNSLDDLRAVFNLPNTLTRGDPRLAEPMAAIRKASLAPSPEPATPNATAAAKSLLSRLYAVSGKNTLTGQENSFQAVSVATDHVFQVTAKYPSIYGADLGVTGESGFDVKAARQAIVDEAKHQAQKHSIVSLTWRAVRPIDDEPASLEQSVHGQLSDFEWNQLLTPGTNLYQRWCAQVDGVAAFLKQLQDTGVAVLWQPYPEPNGKRFWWAARKGNRGSSALYRQLFDRIANHDGVHNLVWVWNVAAPGFGPEAPGEYKDFFPGLVYVDALAINLDDVSAGWRVDSSLALFATGKVVGLGLTARIPSPEVFARQTNWAWFMASPESTSAPETSEALHKLYDDPRFVSREGGPSTNAAPR
jgi:mannan endo-1,4-beta-mannosidase